MVRFASTLVGPLCGRLQVYLPVELAELATKNSRAAAVAPLEEVATADPPRSPRQRTPEELTSNIRQVVRL
jgi:hypothetical protein